MPLNGKNSLKNIFLVGLCLAGLSLANLLLGLGKPLGLKSWENLETQEVLLSLGGWRELAGDFVVIELMLAYAEHEHEHAQEADAIYIISKRLMALDPLFRYGIEFAVAALAFSLNQDERAVELLNSAIQADGQYWPYSLYLASIAYKKANNYSKALDELEKIRRFAQCPTMLKNIMANIYIKLGKTAEAIFLYQEMLSAPESDYRDLAQKKLKTIVSRQQLSRE